MEIKPIARIRTDFPTKFGLPRQSGLASNLQGRIVFEREYRHPDALRGIEGFSHLWLIWDFSAAHRDTWSATVRPPRLGGNIRMGVFATRSPFRPNPIGLSLVRLEKIEQTENEGNVLLVSGADIMDNTPIFDIKPYLPYVESIPDARGGFSDEYAHDRLQVDCPESLLAPLPEEKRAALLEALSLDPRPSYQTDESRVYGFLFAGYDIRFTVVQNIIHVLELVSQN